MKNSRPNYDVIAESILSHGATPKSLAIALNAAYDRGRDDGIDQEEMDMLLKARVKYHVEKVDALANRIGAFTQELRAAFPREK